MTNEAYAVTKNKNFTTFNKIISILINYFTRKLFMKSTAYDTKIPTCEHGEAGPHNYGEYIIRYCYGPDFKKIAKEKTSDSEIQLSQSKKDAAKAFMGKPTLVLPSAKEELREKIKLTLKTVLPVTFENYEPGLNRAADAVYSEVIKHTGSV